MLPKIFYLGGPICNEQDPISWRRDITEFLKELGHSVIDPTDIVNLEPILAPLRKKNDRALIKIIMDEWILQRDKKSVDKADIVIAYQPRFTAGTMNEVSIAYWSKKPRLIVASEDTINSNSLIGMATEIFDNLDDLKNYIEDNYRVDEIPFDWND
jgi:nucleoside 2-deoxyribosyltransferase